MFADRLHLLSNEITFHDQYLSTTISLRDSKYFGSMYSIGHSFSHTRWVDYLFKLKGSSRLSLSNRAEREAEERETESENERIIQALANGWRKD